MFEAAKQCRQDPGFQSFAPYDACFYEHLRLGSHSPSCQSWSLARRQCTDSVRAIVPCVSVRTTDPGSGLLSWHRRLTAADTLTQSHLRFPLRRPWPPQPRDDAAEARSSGALPACPHASSATLFCTMVAARMPCRQRVPVFFWDLFGPESRAVA